jgi:hypothetical protein
MSLSLDEEVRLYTTNAEREKHNLLGTLFGIIVALDYLERAYVRDSVPATEYIWSFGLLMPFDVLILYPDIRQHVPNFSHNTRLC